MLIGFRSNQMTFLSSCTSVVVIRLLVKERPLINISQDERNYQFHKLNTLIFFSQSIKMLIQPIYYQMGGLTMCNKFRNDYDSWDFYWKMVNYGCVNLRQSKFGPVWLKMLFMCLIEKTVSSGFQRFVVFFQRFYNRTLEQFLNGTHTSCIHNWSFSL